MNRLLDMPEGYKIHTTQKVEKTGDGTEVRISRDPDKPLLFLLRMASRDMGVWDTSWDYLCQYFSVAQFDLTMPPATEMSDTPLMFKNLAQCCVDVAHDLGFEQFHLLGWTGGAHVALSCAANFPEHVKSTTLIAPFFKLPDSRQLTIATEFMRVLMENGGRSLYSYYWFMAGLSPAFVQNRFDQVERWVHLRLDGDRFIQADTQRAIRWIQALRSFSLATPELSSITIPTLIIGPGLDPAHIGPNADMAIALHKNISGSELEIATDYGSLLLLEAPEVFETMSRRFFERITNDSAPG